MSSQPAVSHLLPETAATRRNSQKIDLFSVHDHLVSDGARLAKTGALVAQRIEREVLRGGWKVGSVVGSQSMLRHELGVGQRGLQEAVRILEARSAARMRPGPSGGLVVAAPSKQEVVGGVADYFETMCVPDEDVSEASAALDELRYVLSRQAAAPRSNLSDPSEVEWTGFLCRLTEAPVRMNWPRAPEREEVVVSLFCDALDEVRWRRSHAIPAEGVTARAPETWTADSQADGGGDSPRPRRQVHARGATAVGASQSAELVARLLTEIAGLGADAAGARLGTEDELCDQYGVGRKILRPALRILENDGVLGSQRGRGGGLVVRRPNARGPIEAVVTYFSSRLVKHAEVETLTSRLSDIISAIAVRRRTSSDNVGAADAIGNAVDMCDAKKMADLYKSEWGQCRNPILVFMMHCISSYYSRLLSDVYTASDEQMYSLGRSFSLRSQAISASDICGAREILANRGRLLSSIIPVELVFAA